MNLSTFIDSLDINLSRRLNKEIALREEILINKYLHENIVAYTTKANFICSEQLRFILGDNVIIKEIDKSTFNDAFELVYAFENKETLAGFYLNKAIASKASDIHFEPYRDCVRIRMRVNGDLFAIGKIQGEEYSKILSSIKVKSGLDITERRVPQDGKLRYEFMEDEFDLRISTLPVINGEKMVIRVIYSSKICFDLRELNFSIENLKVIDKIMKVKNGIVIVNGPTGSGKSTTLYSILKKINKLNHNVVTIEDPVEVELKGVNQVSVNKENRVTFPSALRAVLRQDPDTVMLGEVRDEETAEMAIRAALTGHKIYTTVHTKSPREVFWRLEEMGVKRYLLKEAVIGVISQRLIKKLCNHCKEKIKNANGIKWSFYRKVGCSLCNNTGYEGRIAIASVYYIDDGIKSKMNKEEEKGFLSNEPMKKELIQYLKGGIIGLDDFLNFINGEEIELYDEEKEDLFLL